MTTLPTIASPLGRNTTAMVAALAWATLSIGSTVAPAPAHAAAAPYYNVELASAASEPTTIAGGIVWYCQGTNCVAKKGGSQPWIMCRHLAHKTGEITRFTYDGKELAADKLAKCNR